MAVFACGWIDLQVFAAMHCVRWLFGFWLLVSFGFDYGLWCYVSVGVCFTCFGWVFNFGDLV